jgi:hypothetical protein
MCVMSFLRGGTILRKVRGGKVNKELAEKKRGVAERSQKVGEGGSYEKREGEVGDGKEGRGIREREKPAKKDDERKRRGVG